MPLLILAEIVFQGFCIYHCVKTGRTQPWLYIIMLAPGIGPAAYVLFEILPDMANTRRGRRVFTDVRTILDPDREYRERQAEVDMSGTPAAKVALAEESARKGMNDDAIRLYRSALTGIHADDAAMLLDLARVQIGASDFAGCQATLEFLREKNPDFNSPEGHLIFARALEGQNRVEEAITEYEALVVYFPGYEAKSRYGLLQQKLGNIDKARGIFEGVVKSYRLLPRHAQQLNREWFEVARRNVE